MVAAPRLTPLGAAIAARIAQAGPMSVAEYMALCLGHPAHGYYLTRDPFGPQGDFTTAPEVSQMFGELIGAWAAQVWTDQGKPTPFVLCELGPGRGTLMRDALRAARHQPGFVAAARLWLVETSPALRQRQAQALDRFAPHWAGTLKAVPEAPLIAIANEFFDALPVRQFRRTDLGWEERLVTLHDDRFRFTYGPARPDTDLDARFPLLPDGVLVEVSPVAEALAAELAGRLARHGGAALICDYGAREGTGDTLQAVRRHAPADPLAAPGEADLTAHVCFGALAAAARTARWSGPVPQGTFLERLGISARAQALARGLSGPARTAVMAQHHRLTHPQEMGDLFQVAAIASPGSPPLPGLEP